MGKWEMVRLGDVCKFINGDRGKNYPSSDDFVDAGLPFVNAGHLSNDRISFLGMNYITKEKYNSLGSGKIQPDDLLYCLRGSLGKHAIVDIEKGAVASSLVILRPININSRYLLHLMKTDIIQKQQVAANNGSSQPNLSAASVKSYSIPLPPLPVQQEIADVLDRASALIEKRKAQIEKLDSLVKSQFIEMFGDPVRNPMGWESKRLGDIASVGSSKRVFVEELVDSGIPFYRGTEIGAMATGEKVVPSLFIDQEHYDRLRDATGIPQIGDFLLPSICPDGRIWRVNTTEPFYFKDGRVLWVHFADKAFDDTYLLYAIKEKIIADYINIASGTTFAELKIFSLKSVFVLLPPFGLQCQFAAFIQQVEAQKSLLQQSLAKLELNYKSLMQKCFIGEIV